MINMDTTPYTKKIKWRAGKYLIPVDFHFDGKLFYAKFKYNKILLGHVKSMEGAKWLGMEGGPKVWSFKASQRNKFQLEYLSGGNPHANYDLALIDFTSKRPLYDHQIEMVKHALTRGYSIFACEMGTGKTLAAIEVMEYLEYSNEEVWYVGPKSGVRAVNLELTKWDSKIHPRMFTYEGLTKEVKYWDESKPAPKMVIFDESSKIKTPTAQRSQAARHLADAVREEWADEGFIILMSGTPAPKTPIDWWHQCLTKNALISTDIGLQPIENLIEKSFNASFNGFTEHCERGFFKTGVKKIIKITTKEGYSLKCTLNHKIRCSTDDLEYWKEANDLKNGDKICLNNYCHSDGFSKSEEDGYLLGLIYGDGTIPNHEDKYYGVVSVYKNDASVKKWLEKNVKATFANIQNDSDRQDWHSKRLHNIVRSHHCTSSKKINNFILGENNHFLRGFVAGFIDTDGHIEKNRLRVSIGQTDKNRIEKLQQILQHLGIKSQIYEKLTIPGNIKGRTIHSLNAHTLCISTKSARRLAQLVWLRCDYKREALKMVIDTIEIRNQKYTATVLNVKDAGTEDVYDCIVPNHHRFAANGIIVHNCEVACPGFLKEGQLAKFKLRLCVIEERESAIGGVYPHIVTWLDDEKKCAQCGRYEDDESQHGVMGDHRFKKSKNEIELLYRRMQGLVLVKFKKDCLDLPEKQYREIIIRPTRDLLRAAKVIRAKAARTIGALILLRELSDGFQYIQVKTGEDTCPLCHGEGEIDRPIPLSDANDTEGPQIVEESGFEMRRIPCTKCGGSKKVPKYSRETHYVGSPKDEAYINLLDEHEDIGRFIAWGGFTGTIDRLVEIAHKYGWATLRVDGRGYIGETAMGESLDDNELLIAMDGSHPRFKELLETYPKLCFIGHPEAGGMALTLTASPTELFYSNSFKGEARMQSEDRFHRPGMDLNRGATIIDLINLPSDKLVLDNLKQKKKLQNLSMGQLEGVFKDVESVEK